MTEEELREQLKKMFATMHGEELYNVWKILCQRASFWDWFKVYQSFDVFANEVLQYWDFRAIFNTYDASTNFNVNDLYFASYCGKFLSTDNLTIYFPPIAGKLDEAIDTIIRFKDDFGFERIKEVLNGTADEGTFLTAGQEVKNVLKELDTKSLVKVYNDWCTTPKEKIYPMNEFYSVFDEFYDFLGDYFESDVDEAVRNYSRFSKRDDWFFHVPNTNEYESFTDLTIDDSPIAENIDQIIWNAIDYGQDYGIQKIRKVLDKHRKYGESFEPNGYIEY